MVANLKYVLLFVCMITHFGLFSQSNELSSFQKASNAINRKGMLLLGGWAAGNIISGSIGLKTTNREAHYFNTMTIMWNSVNLALAGFGYVKAGKEKSGGLNLTSVLDHQQSNEKTFLFNTALDVAYITAGLYLKERSRRQADPSKLKGYGNAVIMQGGFLMLFDAIMYQVHFKHGKLLKAFTDKVTVVAGPGTLRLLYDL